eukprot:8111962-Pyramimonas_sp.AAC.1
MQQHQGHPPPPRSPGPLLPSAEEVDQALLQQSQVSQATPFSRDEQLAEEEERTQSFTLSPTEPASSQVPAGKSGAMKPFFERKAKLQEISPTQPMTPIGRDGPIYHAIGTPPAGGTPQAASSDSGESALGRQPPAKVRMGEREGGDGFEQPADRTRISS